jgi:hypothetical protein
MQRGGHSDRIALAWVRGGRRWLVRDRDKAGIAPDPPTERLGIHEIEVSVVSPKEASTASPSSGPALADARADVRMRPKGRSNNSDAAGQALPGALRETLGQAAEVTSLGLV